MAIRLEGGLEISSYWQGVRDAGNDLLKDAGYAHWSVTLMPLTASLREQTDLNDDDEISLDVNEKRNTLSLAIPCGEFEDQIEASDFVSRHIVDIINQLVEGPVDDGL